MRKWLGIVLIPTAVFGTYTLGVGAQPALASKVSQCVASDTATLTAAYNAANPKPTESLSQILTDADLKSYCSKAIHGTPVMAPDPNGSGSGSGIEAGSSLCNVGGDQCTSYTLTICGGFKWPCQVPINPYVLQLIGWTAHNNAFVHAYDHVCNTSATAPFVGITYDFCGFVSVDGDPAGIGGVGYATNYALLRDIYTDGICVPFLGCFFQEHKWYWLNLYSNGGWKWGCREC